MSLKLPQFTKNAIINSFIKLLNEKPLDKITVKEIVDDCGINRNTFYYHFEDIRALVSDILNTETERVLAEHVAVGSWEDGFIAAAMFALENRKAIYHIYNSVSREELERYLNSIAKDVMTKFVRRISEEIKPRKEDEALIINLYKYVLVGMTLDWIENGMKEDPEALIHRIGQLLEGNIAVSLRKSAQR